MALVIATALSVFKPRGLTPFDQGGDSRGSGLQQWGWTQIAMILVGVGLGILVVAHLITGSARH